MHTKLLPHPGQSGFGLLSSLGLSLLRMPVRSVPAATTAARGPATVQGRHSVRDAARELSERPPTAVAQCDINEVLHRMVRIARTLVLPGVRIAESYAKLEQTGSDVPEFHQVVLHLILDAAQALQGCGTIDIASLCVDGQILITVSDTRAPAPAGWGLMAPLLKAAAEPHDECSNLGLLMAGDFTEEYGGGVRTTRSSKGGHTVTLALPMTLPVLS